MLPVVCLVFSLSSPMPVPPRFPRGSGPSVHDAPEQPAQPFPTTGCGNLARRAATITGLEPAFERPLHWPTMTAPAPALDPTVWVVVPTYDEAENIRPITAAILEALPAATILVVDDG